MKGCTITRTGHASRRCRGNALLDMALVMPVLLMLSFGAIEYGYALFIKHSLQGAAREGARVATLPGATAADVQAAVDQTMLIAGFGPTKYTRPALIEPSNWSTAGAGMQVRVTVHTTWGTVGVRVLPTYLGGISSEKQLRAATAMRREG